LLNDGLGLASNFSSRDFDGNLALDAVFVLRVGRLCGTHSSPFKVGCAGGWASTRSRPGFSRSINVSVKTEGSSVKQGRGSTFREKLGYPLPRAPTRGSTLDRSPARE